MKSKKTPSAKSQLEDVLSVSDLGDAQKLNGYLSGQGAPVTKEWPLPPRVMVAQDSGWPSLKEHVTVITNEQMRS